MGLFTTLLTLPLAPVRGVSWVAEQVADEADRQLYDEDRIRAELLQLEIEAEDGNLDDEERQRMEDELFERLAVAQERKAAQEYDFDQQDVYLDPDSGAEHHLTEEDVPATVSREGYADG